MATSPRPPDAETPSIDTFFKSVLRSGLLDQSALQVALAEAPPERRDDARLFAEHLIKKGKLSRFQASKLLKGTAKGLILGDYQILAPLGKGGMGTVYMARDQRNGRLLALKVLPPHRAKTEERTLLRFQREMELCRKVAHPHIALTYETGQYKGVYFIAMEYVPGKSLYRLVAEEGPLNVPRAAHLGLEIASALEHAHQQGLIHRDLKPSNVVVTPHNHAKVLDFGLALVAGETGEVMILGGHGYIVGSMDYISPEQTFDASKVNARADIYGLGCSLYYTLTGQPPFPGGTSAEKIYKHRNDLPPPLSQLRPDLPMDFAELVHRMMAKDSSHRYQTAREVVDALRPWALTQLLQPLDRPDDTAFHLAIAALQTSDAPTELSTAELPKLDDTDDQPALAVGIDSKVGISRGHQETFHERRRREVQLQFLLIGAGVVGALFLGMLLLACVVAAMLR